VVNVIKTEVCYRTKSTGTQVFKGHEYETFYSDETSSVHLKDASKVIVEEGTFTLVDCSCEYTCESQKPLVSCDWHAFDSPITQWRIGEGNWRSEYPITTKEGLIYEVQSFMIDGVEQLTNFHYYTILNPGNVATFGPYAHEGLTIHTNAYSYIGNLGAIFGTLFQATGLETNWKCLVNPLDNNTSGKILRFLYPKEVASWSITVVRHDGISYTYTSDGKLVTTDGSWDSDLAGYTYCKNAVDVGISPPSQCQYLCWDRAQTESQESATPFVWTVSYFSINGIPQLSAPFSRTITSADIVLSPDPSFTLNNEIFLNAMFTHLNLASEWHATITGNNTFDLTYPGKALEFLLVIVRSNGESYTYQDGGRTASYNGFIGENSYGIKCVSLNGLKVVNPRRVTKIRKLETPLTIPPPKRSEDIRGLLRTRLKTVTSLIKSKTGAKFKLYLFGSQIKGISSSGYPDIDVWVVPEKGRNWLERQDQEKLLADVKKAVDFQLDITVLTAENLSRMSYVEFK